MKIRPAGAELFHADRQTDMTKLIVTFRNYANAPSKKLSVRTNSWPIFFFNSGLPYGSFVLGKCEVTSVRRTSFLDDNRTPNFHNN
jgi:hypothetical protein